MKVTELYAVVDDTDGMVGFMSDNVWHPLVFNTLTPAKLAIAQGIANATEKTLTLVKFSNREDLQKIEPQ